MSAATSKGSSTLDRGLQIIGALAGLGGLIYAVGAVVVWLRFATTGFDADEALVPVAREQLIVVGFRWVLGWALTVAVFVLVAGNVYIGPSTRGE